MAAAELENDKPLTRDDELCEIFESAEKPASEHRIGAEMEKFGVTSDGAPVQYAGDRGVRKVLETLAATNGWAIDRESADGPIIALVKNGASITLEPGGQFELSGAPFDNVHQICAEFRGHLREIAPISKELGILWLGAGFHPFSTRAEYSLVPKLRYPIMRDYLPTRGQYALDMMLRTSTVQANYDFTSEKDAIRKLQVGLKLGPLTTAIFANSPFYEGGRHGGKSYRAKVWTAVDPDRSGLLPTMWKANASYRDYAEWALDVPMFMIKREGKAVLNTGQTFRRFWKDGFEGHRAMLSDWHTHLNTLFPEVRLKKTIEVRGADAQGAAMACALPALWTGLYYDEKALAEAEALTADYTFDEVNAVREQVWKDGLGVSFRGATLTPIAEKVLEIAEGGLERRARAGSGGKDERVHLSRIKELVHLGHSPADALLEAVPEDPPSRAAVIAATMLS